MNNTEMGEPVEKFDPLASMKKTDFEKLLEAIDKATSASKKKEHESSYEKSVQSSREQLLDPAIPVLVPAEIIVTSYLKSLLPGIEAIAEKLSKEPTPAEEILNKQLHLMAVTLLKKWSENIAIMSEKRREEEKNAEHIGNQEYIQYKQHLEKMLQKVEVEGNLEKDTRVFELMAMLLVGTSLTSLALEPIPISSPDFSMLPTIQQIQHVTMNIIPVDEFRAELGLIGALFAASTLYRTTWMTIAENQGKVGPKKNATFAKNYAMDIQKLVEGKKLDHFVLNTCINAERSGKVLTDARIEQLTAMVKLVHLVSAIAVIYWIETKNLTAQEIADMISGKMQLPEKDIRLPLLQLIQKQLALIPPEEKQKVLRGLLEYIDSKPKVDDLMEPSQVFDNLNTFIGGTVRG